MKTGNSSACNRYEHKAPNRRPGGMHIAEMGSDFRDLIPVHGKTYCYADGHGDQAEAEYRVDSADNGVNGYKGGNKIVDQDDGQPGCRGYKDS